MADGRPEDAAAANGGDSFAEAHAALREDPALQFRFTDFEPPRRPSWLDPLGDFFEAIAPFLKWVFWIGLAAIVAMLLYVVVREIIQRWPQRRPKGEAEEAPEMDFRPTHARAHALLEEADRLAREGRYSEAARVILHRSIEDIEAQYPITISAAMTSREIAGIHRLSERVRDVFAKIARAVETSLFGGRDLSAAEYQECRALYETFAFGGRAA